MNKDSEMMMLRVIGGCGDILSPVPQEILSGSPDPRSVTAWHNSVSK
jgi:hypothetical protein